MSKHFEIKEIEHCIAEVPLMIYAYVGVVLEQLVNNFRLQLPVVVWFAILILVPTQHHIHPASDVRQTELKVNLTRQRLRGHYLSKQRNSVQMVDGG